MADNTRKRKAEVAFNYTAENPDELSLPLRSTVEILGEEEEGWWRGKLDGKEGVFPSNFVQLIEETEITPSKPGRRILVCIHPIMIMYICTIAKRTRPPSMIAMPGPGGINPNEFRLKLKPVSPATGSPVSKLN